MNKDRVEGLADGIFAITMTILVIDLKVPVVGIANSNSLYNALYENRSIFISYILSFAVLFTYWRAYHFIMSVYAQNTNLTLTNYNFLFFFFIGLIPFSSQILGHYPSLTLALLIYGINVVCIGLALGLMRMYVHKSEQITKLESDLIDNRYAYVRIGVPIVCALIAMLLSFFSTYYSIILFIIAILFNIFPFSADFIVKILCKISDNKKSHV